MLKADTERKQQSILSSLDQKRKELQKQNETIDKLNRELKQLDVPVNKEIATLREKVAKASKLRKQKESELLQAIDLVSKLADEKCALTERLKSIMYDFESAKQRKLKELEEEMKKMGM